jgi:hypothetical protein
METTNKSDQKVQEQKWENPLNPEKPGDARDREQLERQYKEAKRRNENLTTEDKNKQTKN